MSFLYQNWMLVNTVLQLWFIACTIVFLWGLVRAIVYRNDSSAKANGKRMMFYSILAFLILVFVWGLIRLNQPVFSDPF